MTDQGNLRDRIADLIVRGETLSREGSEYAAQAIIDELGLTVTEAPMMGADWQEGNQHPIIEYRIVGKWESVE